MVEESVSESLVERFSKCPATAGPERRLQTVTLVKKDGSLGVMIAEGVDHGIYIQAVSPGGPADEQGYLKPGDRIVGINGRSVENLPYTGAVDLLRQIDSEVTLLVSQPVISTSYTTTPTPSTSSVPEDSSRRPLPPQRGNATGDSDLSGHNHCKGNECEGKGEKGCPRLKAIGGARTFIREVRSGPVTVITVNTDPSILDDAATPTSTHTTPTHSGSLKQTQRHLGCTLVLVILHPHLLLLKSQENHGL